MYSRIAKAFAVTSLAVGAAVGGMAGTASAATNNVAVTGAHSFDHGRWGHDRDCDRDCGFDRWGHHRHHDRYRDCDFGRWGHGRWGHHRHHDRYRDCDFDRRGHDRDRDCGSYGSRYGHGHGARVVIL